MTHTSRKRIPKETFVLSSSDPELRINTICISGSVEPTPRTHHQPSLCSPVGALKMVDQPRRRQSCAKGLSGVRRVSLVWLFSAEMWALCHPREI